jgi:hypothetical protein
MFDLSNCFVLQTTELSVLTKYTFDNFIKIKKKEVFRTYMLQTKVFVHIPIHIKILNIQQRIE